MALLNLISNILIFLPCDWMKCCDYCCEHATTNHTDNAAGACQREIVLFCEKHGKFVKKNAPCIDSSRELRDKDPEYQRLFGKKI